MSKFFNEHKITPSAKRAGMATGAIIALVGIVLAVLVKFGVLRTTMSLALFVVLAGIGLLVFLGFYFWPSGFNTKPEEDEDEVRMASLKSEAESCRQVAKKDFVKARRARTAYKKAKDEYLAFKEQLREEEEAFEDYLED